MNHSFGIAVGYKITAEDRRKLPSEIFFDYVICSNYYDDENSDYIFGKWINIGLDSEKAGIVPLESAGILWESEKVRQDIRDKFIEFLPYTAIDGNHNYKLWLVHQVY